LANFYGRPVTGRVAFTLPHGYVGSVGVRIDVKAVIARLLNGERHIGRVHFIGLAVIKVTHAQVQCSLVKLQLRGLVGNVCQRHAGFRAHTKNAGTDVQFSF